LFLEHLIGATKQACRDGQSLDKMKEVSSSLDFSQAIRDTVRKETGISSSSSHSKPDTRTAVKDAAGTLLQKPAFLPATEWKNPFLEGVSGDLEKYKRYSPRDFQDIEGSVGEVAEFDGDIE